MYCIAVGALAACATLQFLLFLSPIVVSCSVLKNRGENFVLEQHSQYVLDGIGQFQPEPLNFDFWKEAEKIGVTNLTIYADKAIREEAVNFGYTTGTAATSTSFLDSVDEFKALMQELVSSAKALKIDSALIGRYSQRAEVLDKTLDKVEDAFVRTDALWNDPEAEGRGKFGKVRPHIRSAVLSVGTLAENHPLLVGAILFAAVALVIPEGLFLRGALRLFGFGPLGPVKGSVAAWAQRYFFGAVVKEGSWFSRLQRAGMGWWGR